jgi:hypothetical protein
MRADSTRRRTRGKKKDYSKGEQYWNNDKDPAKDPRPVDQYGNNADKGTVKDKDPRPATSFEPIVILSIAACLAVL